MDFYRVQPSLNRVTKLRWKKLRAAIKQDIITQDGIEFYENQILIDEGLRVNRTSVMNSPQYAQWLRNETFVKYHICYILCYKNI